MGSVWQYGQLKMALASLQLAGMPSEVRRGGDEVADCLRQSLPYFSPSADKQGLSSHFTDEETERWSTCLRSLCWLAWELVRAQGPCRPRPGCPTSPHAVPTLPLCAAAARRLAVLLDYEPCL